MSASNEGVDELLDEPSIASKMTGMEMRDHQFFGIQVAVSFVLVREDKGTQYPIYYVSKTLLDTKTRYPHLEKLALALIVAAKLRPYF